METKLKLAIQEALSKIGASVEIKDIVIDYLDFEDYFRSRDLEN